MYNMPRISRDTCVGLYHQNTWKFVRRVDLYSMECIHFCRVLNPAEYTKRHSKMKMKFIDYDHEITMITINE